MVAESASDTLSDSSAVLQSAGVTGWEVLLDEPGLVRIDLLLAGGCKADVNWLFIALFPPTDMQLLGWCKSFSKGKWRWISRILMKWRLQIQECSFISSSVNPTAFNHCDLLDAFTGKWCIESVGDFLDLMCPQTTQVLVHSKQQRWIWELSTSCT